jgi:hypothetical protein
LRFRASGGLLFGGLIFVSAHNLFEDAKECLGGELLLESAIQLLKQFLQPIPWSMPGQIYNN